MKKVLFFLIILGICIYLPVTSHADNILTGPSSSSTLEAFQPSNNVSIGYHPGGTASGGVYPGYAIVSKHSKGDTYYGAVSDNPSLFRRKDSSSKGTALASGDIPSSTDATTAFPTGDGWKSM